MKLVFRDGKTYEPTADDKLWLLRAVEAEGPIPHQVARALVNGFGLLYSSGQYKTLAQFVRAYAQPVNPRWYPDGDLFRASIKGPPTSSDLAQAERRKSLHSTRTTFSADTKAAVDNALSTPYPSDVTDYAAPTLDASKRGYQARSEPTAGVNRLWARQPGWPGYAVDGAESGGVATLLALALALYLASRSRS